MKDVTEIQNSVASIVLVDGHHGVYVPQVFIEKYKANLELECESLLEDIAIIESETEDVHSETYLESWIALTEQTQVILDDVAYALYTNENGDLIGYSIDAYNDLSNEEQDALWEYLM